MVKTKAIVLLKKDYNEFDSLVSFYTLDFGKINLLARGLKKSSSKLSGHLEPLNLVELMIIKGRERDYVGSAISDNSFLNIKNNYLKTIIAGKAIKFIKDLTYPQQTDFNVFLILKDFLIHLNNLLIDPDEIDSWFIFFKFKVLQLLGYDFSFSRCFRCGHDKPLFFDFFNKEVICFSCSQLLKLKSSQFIKVSLDFIETKNNVILNNFSDLKNINLSKGVKKELDNFTEIIKKII